MRRGRRLLKTMGLCANACFASRSSNPMHMLSVFWPKLHNRQAMLSDVQRFAASPCFGSQFMTSANV